MQSMVVKLLAEISRSVQQPAMLSPPERKALKPGMYVKWTESITRGRAVLHAP